MKKIYFSLLVVATAVGMSSFINAPQRAPLVDTYYYTLDQDSGMYEYYGTTPPSVSSHCGGTASYSCAIGFSSKYSDELTPGSLPATTTYNSSNGYYN